MKVDEDGYGYSSYGSDNEGGNADWAASTERVVSWFLHSKLPTHVLHIPRIMAVDLYFGGHV